MRWKEFLSQGSARRFGEQSSQTLQPQNLLGQKKAQKKLKSRIVSIMTQYFCHFAADDSFFIIILFIGYQCDILCYDLPVLKTLKESCSFLA